MRLRHIQYVKRSENRYGQQILSVLDIDGSSPHLAASTSTIVRIYPKPAYYLQFSQYPSTVTAGVPFSMRLSAYDEYRNLCSTGVNTYTGTVNFSANICKYKSKSYFLEM